MLSRWLAFVVWALLGATVVTVLLQLLANPMRVPSYAVAVDTSTSIRSDLTRLFGTPAATATSTEPVRGDDRFKLVGLVASSSAAGTGSSLALISIDGKPARAYKVGALVDGDRKVLAVRKGTVELGPSGGPVALTLSVPELPPAATGKLPADSGAPAPMAAGAPPPQMAPQPNVLDAQGRPPQPVQPSPGTVPAPQPIEAQPVGAPQTPPTQPG
jgi:general secretion pathway protein C